MCQRWWLPNCSRLSDRCRESSSIRCRQGERPHLHIQHWRWTQVWWSFGLDWNRTEYSVCSGLQHGQSLLSRVGGKRQCTQGIRNHHSHDYWENRTGGAVLWFPHARSTRHISVGEHVHIHERLKISLESVQIYQNGLTIVTKFATLVPQNMLWFEDLIPLSTHLK